MLFKLNKWGQNEVGKYCRTVFEKQRPDKEDLLIGERKRRQKLSRTYALAKEDLLIGERLL
ncbi:hypothetical protein V1498_04840 [Peribacillus sp. SCS-26]|uniref:hypothetical protein n=1 Tax=Paraperibacillus marinus TaxID=3115295 RepID=UPI003906B8DA